LTKILRNQYFIGNKLNKILTTLIFVVLAGCSKTSIIMTSEPSDAQVTINDNIVRYTPFEVSYSNAQKRSLIYAVRKNGYDTVKGVITPIGGNFHIDLKTSKIITSEPFMSIDDLAKEDARKRDELEKREAIEDAEWDIDNNF